MLAPRPLYEEPAVPTTEERELALCTFKPKINSSPRPAASSSRIARKEAWPQTSEERELAHCTFRPKTGGAHHSKNGSNDLQFDRQSLRLTSEEREVLDHCTFTPKVNARPPHLDRRGWSLRRGQGSISVKVVEEVRKFKVIHPLVSRVLDVVLILLQQPVGWRIALRVFETPHLFLAAVAVLRKEDVTDETLARLRPHLSAPDLTVENVSKVSTFAMILLDWALDMVSSSSQTAEEWVADPPSISRWLAHSKLPTFRIPMTSVERELAQHCTFKPETNVIMNEFWLEQRSSPRRPMSSAG